MSNDWRDQENKIEIKPKWKIEKSDGCGYTSTSQLDFLRITRWEKARTKQINDVILGITFSREQTNCL